MCHRAIATALLITALFGAGCRAHMSSVQSQFFIKFSLRELFAKNEFSAGLDCSETRGGGGMSMGTGGVGIQGSNFSRLDTVACQITDPEIFDEAKFIEALRESVLKDLQEYKATVVGPQKTDGKGFVLEYGLTDVAGTLKVSGTRGPARFYTLEANLDEKSKHTR